MPLNKNIKKTLVIGSGPIIIGQAAEFDYSGTQACQALKEEGIEVVLVNSNPATIMTDREVADKVYLEPLNIDFIEKIIREEKPDSLLAGMGGQTALNLAVELNDAGILEKYKVKVLGTSVDSIKRGEDRDLFRQMMKEIDEPSFTLTAQDRHGIFDGSRVRRLTEKECERLQGYSDNWTQYGNYDGDIKELSSTQRYKLCGNAVSKLMVQWIGSKMKLNFR